MLRKLEKNDLSPSPFHIACMEHNVEVVSKFLNEKQIDVNRPTDSSPKSHLAGQTPLHLVLRSDNGDDVARLAIIDMLLENGAQINAKDLHGETPLHYAVRLNGDEKSNILKKIMEAGADVDAFRTSGNIPGVTALNHLLCFEYYSAEQLELFVERGARLNGYNPLNEGGYLAAAFLSRGIKSEKKNMLFDTMLKYPRTIEPDDQGRTAIHSLVAHSGTALSVNDYAQLMDELAFIAGCDVNDQDNKGRTALYFAAHHGNEYAIQGLLIAGADINVADKDGKVAFDYVNKRYGSNTSVAMARQVRKLESLDLDVSEKNQNFAKNVFKKYDYEDTSLREAIQRELELAKSIQVVLPSLSLRHFLHEMSSKATAAIIGDDTAIKEFFQNFEDERFAELRTVFTLQYKKAVDRSKLIEPASVALDVISGCSVLISEMIVRFLKNDDLKNLIEASTIM